MGVVELANKAVSLITPNTTIGNVHNVEDTKTGEAINLVDGANTPENSQIQTYQLNVPFIHDNKFMAAQRSVGRPSDYTKNVNGDETGLRNNGIRLSNPDRLSAFQNDIVNLEVPKMTNDGLTGHSTHQNKFLQLPEGYEVHSVYNNIGTLAGRGAGFSSYVYGPGLPGVPLEDFLQANPQFATA